MVKQSLSKSEVSLSRQPDTDEVFWSNFILPHAVHIHAAHGNAGVLPSSWGNSWQNTATEVLKPLDNPSVKAAPMKRQEIKSKQNITTYSDIKCRSIVAHACVILEHVFHSNFSLWKHLNFNWTVVYDS